MADQQQVKKAISLLLASYPRANGGDQDSMRQYLVLVENFLIQYPTEMVLALASPRNGIVAECVHFPSIAEMKKFMDREWAEISRRRVAENQEEVKRLHAPEPPPVHDEAHRAMMRQKFRDLIEELKGQKDEPLMTREEYQAKLEKDLEQLAERAKSDPLPQFSPTLKKILDLP